MFLSLRKQSVNWKEIYFRHCQEPCSSVVGVGFFPPFKKIHLGNSLVVQWLGLGTFIAGAWVQSLIELRSCKLCSTARKKKKKEKHFS